MGLVERLRMQNIFPDSSMQLGFNGQLPKYGGSDPLEDVINRFREMRGQGGDSRISQVATRLAQPSNADQPLRFGGVIGSSSNPGADIMARSTRHAEQLYDSYGKPQITAGEVLAKAGIKPNEQFPTQTSGFMLKEKEIQGDLTKEKNKHLNDIALERERTAGDQKLETQRQAGAKNLQDDKQNFENEKWSDAVQTYKPDGTLGPVVQFNQKGESRPITSIGTPKKDGTTPSGSTGTDQLSTKPPVPNVLKNIRSKAEESLLALDELLDNKTGKLTPVTASSVGGSRMNPMGYLPGSDIRAGDAAINRFKNLQVLQLIGEMKAQSKTGATGFGALSAKELAVLESAATKLDPMLDEETFTKELTRIKDRLKLILQDNPNDKTDATDSKKLLTPEEYIKKYGGE